MKKIAIVPIDNRPICHTLIEQICAIDKNIELFLPGRELLGGLTTQSKIDEILNWLSKIEKVDYLILSLDTIAYGGLVNSRMCPETYDEILARIKKLEEIIKKKAGKIYAFSSIMRISNNNINEEEKKYWAQWGKKIFEYSYHLHKSRRLKTKNCVINTIPKEILKDYITTRERNFKINKYYLNLAQNGLFDTLIFSKDDTGEFGLNVEEAEILANMIKTAEDKPSCKQEYCSQSSIFIKTGADEIPLTLLARAITDNNNISVSPVFLNPEGKNKISKYEDITLVDCVKSQLGLAGLDVAESNTDLNFIINNFENTQGDLVLGEANISSSKKFDKTKPYFIADVNNANGADTGFMEEFLSDNISACAGGINSVTTADWENFYGYCGYNTSANSIGCVICIAVTKFLAKNHGNYNDEAFKKLVLIRLLDDWAYQAKIRKAVREQGEKQGYFDISSFITEFKPYENKICEFLGLNCGKIKYELPWKRSFEIEIKL